MKRTEAGAEQRIKSATCRAKIAKLCESMDEGTRG
jgi:hypothetical protein